MLSLNIMFIRKLVIVYKSTAGSVQSVSGNNHNHESLITPITKLTVLLSFSVGSVILNIIAIIIQIFISTRLTWFIGQLVGVMDLYSNFLNVMLTHAVFNDYYQILCGRVDISCRNCWMRVINKKDNNFNVDRELSELVNVNSVTSTTETDSNK